MFSNAKLSLPKLDLTESQGGPIHHLAVQFSEFDITTFRPAFGIADTIADIGNNAANHPHHFF